MESPLTIQLALNLGWEMTDAYGDAVEPGTTSREDPPARLPGVAELDRGRLFALRVARITSGLELAIGSAGIPLLETNAAGDPGAGQPGGSREAFRGRLLTAHHAVIETLAVRDPLLEKAYELGGLLAWMGLEPSRAEPLERAQKVREALSAPRLEAAAQLLDQLRSALPRHSARAVDRSLAQWAEWMASSASGVGWAGSTGERVVDLLRDQAESWRMLLTGEKLDQDVLGVDAQVAAAKRLGVQLRRLELGHLRRFATWWGLGGIVVLGALVGLAAVGTGPIGASAVLVLGCLGAYRVVTAGLPAVRGRAQEAMWEAEMDHAIVAAITRTPERVDEPVMVDAPSVPSTADDQEFPQDSPG